MVMYGTKLWWLLGLGRGNLYNQRLLLAVVVLNLLLNVVQLVRMGNVIIVIVKMMEHAVVVAVVFIMGVVEHLVAQDAEMEHAKVMKILRVAQVIVDVNV